MSVFLPGEKEDGGLPPVTPAADTSPAAAAPTSEAAPTVAPFNQALADADAAMEAEKAARDQQQQHRDALDASLGKLKEAATGAPDYKALQYIDMSRGLIGAAQEHGALTPDAARELSRNWVQDYLRGEYKNLPPERRFEIAKDHVDGVGEKHGPLFAMMPADDWSKRHGEAARDVAIQQARGAVDAAEGYRRAIVDASGGVQNLPARTAIENDAALDAAHRTDVLKQYDDAVAGAQRFSDFRRRAENGEAIAADNPDDRADAEAYFRYLGADDSARKAVLQRTGIDPVAATEQVGQGEAAPLPEPSTTQQASPASRLQLAGEIPQGITLPHDRVASKTELLIPTTSRTDEKANDAELNRREQDQTPVRLVQNGPVEKSNTVSDPSLGKSSENWRERKINQKKELARVIEEEANRVGINPRWLKTIIYIESSADPQAKNDGGYRGLLQLHPNKEIWQNYMRTRFAADSEGKTWQQYLKDHAGDITDPVHNLRAALPKLVENYQRLSQDIPNLTIDKWYLSHQQGEGGITEHTRNPDGLAWQNMRATKEGRVDKPKRYAEQEVARLKAEDDLLAKKNPSYVRRTPGEITKLAKLVGESEADAWAKRAIMKNIPGPSQSRLSKVDEITSRDFMDAWKREFDGADLGEFFLQQSNKPVAPSIGNAAVKPGNARIGPRPSPAPPGPPPSLAPPHGLY